MESSSQQTHAQRDLNPRTAALALLGIVFVGAALRAYHLGSESVWWDEYTSVMHLGAPDLVSFLKLNRSLDPATLPLYYSIEYLVWRHVSSGILALRMVSVCLSLLTFPLVYLLGKRLFGRAAGIVAALCFALSPVHIFHAQGIRMYVMLDLLAVASAYTFVRILQSGGRRWWAAHLLVNFLLLWTHPFTVLIMAVEGAFLVLARYRAWRMVGAWIAAHGVLLIPSVVYFAQVRYWSPTQTEAWLRMPTVLEFLGDLVGDDVISCTYQLRVSQAAFGFLPSSLAHALSSAHGLFDAALLGLALGCVAFAIRGVVNRTESPERAVQRRERTIFLLLWLCLPALLLYAASLASRPCIFPRYTLYSSVALYLLIGGVVGTLRNKDAAFAAVAAIAGLFAYQAALVLPGPQRTDWNRAAALVAAQGGPRDLVLVRAAEPKLAQASREMFVLAAGKTERPVSFAKDLDVLADQARFYLEWCARTYGDREARRKAWATLVLPPFDSGPSKEFESQLAARGLTFTTTELGGIEHLLVYGISYDPNAVVQTPPEAQGVVERAKAFGDLALALAEVRDYPAALAALERVSVADTSVARPYENLAAALRESKDAAPLVAAVRAFLKGTGYQENGQLDLAAVAFRQATELDPHYVVAWHSLATTLIDAERYRDALPALHKTVSLYVGDALVFGHLADVIAANSDIASARRALALFLEGVQKGDTRDTQGMMEAFRESIKTDPAYGLAYFALGIAQLDGGDDNSALANLRKSCELDIRIADLFQPFFDAFFVQKDYGRAWQALEAMRAKGFDVPTTFVDRLKRDSGRDQ